MCYFVLFCEFILEFFVFSTFLMIKIKKSLFFFNFYINSSLSTSRMDNLLEIRTHASMILNFVHKQIIKSFVNILRFFDKINRHTKMHIITKKSVIFAKLCVRKPMINGSKMT